MTVSVLIHGKLHEVSAYPENSGSVRLEVRDRSSGSVNDVTIFTGSPEAAREIYEALWPIFVRHGGTAGPVHVMRKPEEAPDKGAPPPEPASSDDGWIEWQGGACPVRPLDVVEWKLRTGAIYAGPASATTAASLDWRHDCRDFDIVAYRVVTGGSNADPLT